MPVSKIAILSSLQNSTFKLIYFFFLLQFGFKCMKLSKEWSVLVLKDFFGGTVVCFIHMWKLLNIFYLKKKLINDMYNYNSMIFCILFFKINALNVKIFFINAFGSVKI